MSTTTHNDEDSIDLPAEDLEQFAWDVLGEMPSDNMKMFGVPDEVGFDELREAETHAEYEGRGIISFRGELETKKQVGMRPASGGGRLEPPTNPPEPILEDVTIMFDLKLELSHGMAQADLEAETW